MTVSPEWTSPTWLPEPRLDPLPGSAPQMPRGWRSDVDSDSWVWGGCPTTLLSFFLSFFPSLSLSLSFFLSSISFFPPSLPPSSPSFPFIFPLKAQNPSKERRHNRKAPRGLQATGQVPISSADPKELSPDCPWGDPAPNQPKRAGTAQTPGTLRTGGPGRVELG